MDTPDFDVLPDGLVIAGPDRRVRVCNRAAGRLLDLDPRQSLGRPFEQVLPLVDPAGADWWACTDPYGGLRSRTGQPERLLLRPGPGGSAPLELLVTARFGRDEPQGPLTALAVGLRGTAARQRQERSRADLVSTVAHELRSPLTSVKGFTATLLAKWERFTDDQRKLMLETVNADADRVTRLITELLDVSRLESGRLELRRQPVDLAARVQRAFAAQAAAGQPADRFGLQVAGDLPELWADPDKVDQVLGNLVENAVRHGGGRISVRLSPHGTAAIAAEVCDEGPGIDPETLDRVFTKFWKSGRRGGTGLGLFITKGLVEAHGGTIGAATAPGGGTCFRVELPTAVPAFAR